MSAYRFACPHCEQHIECDTSNAGTRIQCPTCQKEMVIPAPPKPTPAPPTPGPVRVRVTSLRPTTTTPAAPQPRSKAPPGSAEPGLEEERRSKKRGLLTLAAIVAGLVVVFVLGLPLFNRWQNRLDEARDKEEGAGVLGDQVGHIADLYNTLDATDPAKMTIDDEASGAGGGVPGSRPGTAQSLTVGAEPGALDRLPLAKATWSPDPPATIPDGRANGSLAGSNFVVQSALLIMGRSAPILSLRHGGDRVPDREVLIYLPAQGGRSVEGATWTVRSTDGAVPVRVLARWKAAGKPGLQQKSYPSGFALKLEFGARSGETLPGRIYLALPDPLQGVVAGLFQATVRMAVTAQPQTPSGSPSSSYDDQ